MLIPEQVGGIVSIFKLLLGLPHRLPFQLDRVIPRGVGGRVSIFKLF